MPAHDESVEELREIYSEVFRDKLSRKENYDGVLRIAERNSEGKLWIIGGFVYRSIVEGVYRQKTKRVGGIIDIDFVAEKLSRDPYVPRGWKQKRTDFSNPSFVRKNHRVDLNDLVNFRTPATETYKPTIENLLKRSPLTVQSIAWDCEGEIIVGDVGIISIDTKKVGVNNIIEAKYEAKRKEFTLEDFVKFKAEQLGFDVSSKKTKKDNFSGCCI